MENPFDFELPLPLQQSIEELEQGIKDHVSYIDCLQDEVHSNARYLDDDEKEWKVIQYYCYGNKNVCDI